MKRKKEVKNKEPLKLDLGCGQSKQPGFTGVDIWPGPSVDVVHDLLVYPWPFGSQSVSEVWCSHFFEHIPGKQRGLWMDELYRVMEPAAKATIIVPYYASMRSIQDFTHEWPPVCEASFLYFNAAWRKENKLDHYPVNCDFDFSYGYMIDPMWATRHEEARAFAIRHYFHVVQDLHVTLTKKG